MKDFARAKISATLGNHPDGYAMLYFEEYDGGNYGLQPKLTDDGILLPSTTQAHYALSLGGSTPDVLERAGKALLTLARNQRKAADGDDSDDADNE